MKKLLFRLVWVPLGLALVVFLVANRRPIAVSLDPLSTEHPAIATPPLPFWIWLAAALLVGFFVGAAGMWSAQRPARQIARAEHKELKALRRDLAARAPQQPIEAAEAPPTLEAY